MPLSEFDRSADGEDAAGKHERGSIPARRPAQQDRPAVVARQLGASPGRCVPSHARRFPLRKRQGRLVETDISYRLIEELHTAIVKIVTSSNYLDLPLFDKISDDRTS